MQIRQPYITSIKPLSNQQQTDKVNSAPRKQARQKLKQHNPRVPVVQSRQTFNRPQAKKIGYALKPLETKQLTLVMAINNHGNTVINAHNLNALNAYTEELNQPLQEQLSMLAGIDFYV